MDFFILLTFQVLTISTMGHLHVFDNFWPICLKEIYLLGKKDGEEFKGQKLARGELMRCCSSKTLGFLRSYTSS